MKLEQTGSEELPGGTKGAHGCLRKGMVWDSGTEESRVVLADENQSYEKLRGFVRL